jgi:hypothetical protein
MILACTARHACKNYKFVSCLLPYGCRPKGKRFPGRGPELAIAYVDSDRQIDFQLWIESLIGPGRS